MRGSTDGNEQLTARTGLLLIALLAALGVTIVRIGPLLWEHLFIGLLLLGPVLLKLASTGYRFVRYYTREPSYRRKGPPPPALRLIAPLVVASTVVVFASGVVLLFLGPAQREPVLLIHKVSFIGWLAVTAVHVLGHLPALRTSLRGELGLPGAGGRWVALGGALLAGLLVALLLVPNYAVWTAPGAVSHHHRHVR